MGHHRKPSDSDSSHFKYKGGASKTSTTLLVRLKNGEEAAWERFAELYTPLIRWWCRKAKNQLSREERKDILQDVLQKVCKSIAQFDHETREGRHFRAWLRTITKNRIIDFLEHRAKRKDVSRLMSDTGHIKLPPLKPVDPLELEDEPSEKSILLNQMLETVRKEFSDKHWDVFTLLLVAGKDSTEVASIMGMTAPAVRKVKSRIVKRIREAYTALGLDDELPDTLGER